MFEDWEEMLVYIVNEDLQSKYAPILRLIDRFGDGTMDRVRWLDENVMQPGRDIAPADADIVLSTIHTCKGAEWDNVVVCDDCVDLNKFSCVPPPAARTANFQNASDAKPETSIPMFVQKSFGHAKDELNIWYVAATRARKRLYLPEKFFTMIATMKTLAAVGDESTGDQVGQIISWIIIWNARACHASCLSL